MEHSSRFYKHARITGPAASFPLRTIRRDIDEVRFHRPHRIVEELIDVFIRTFKTRGFFHIRINGNRSKFRIIQVCITLDFDIAESEDGETRFIDIEAFLAGVFDLLRDPAVLIALARIDIDLGEVTVFIQRFANLKNLYHLGEQLLEV